MKTALRRIGNSLGIIIPKPIVASWNLREGDALHVSADGIFPVRHASTHEALDEATAVLPKGWKARLVSVPETDTGGVRGLCLDPHDLAISKYIARREKDLAFTREMARRGYTSRKRLLELVKVTSVSEETRQRIRADIARDFQSAG